jgi:hypothetical protein
MGKIDIKTKVSDKVSALWRGFIKKSPVFIVLTSLTVVSVLGLGVGGTLAATGIIPDPFASSSSELGSEPSELGSEPSELGSEPPKVFFPESRWDYSVPEPEEGQVGDCWFRSLRVQENGIQRKKLVCNERVGLEEVTEWGGGPSAMAESGWTGVKYNFSDQSFLLAFMGTYTVGATLFFSLSINGHSIEGSFSKCVDQGFGTCGSSFSAPYSAINERISSLPDKCKAEGDTFTIEVVGAGLDFRESVIIPTGVINCPTPVSSPSPSPEAVVVTPSPESSPTPESSSEPTSSPTPTP